MKFRKIYLTPALIGMVAAMGSPQEPVTLTVTEGNFELMVGVDQYIGTEELTALSYPSISGYFSTRSNPANSDSPNAPLLVHWASTLVTDNGSTIDHTALSHMVLETSESGLCPVDFVSTLPVCPPCTYQEFIGNFSLENGTGDLAGIRAHGEEFTSVCREDFPPFISHVATIGTGQAFSVGGPR